MSIADKLALIAQNEQKVFEAGKKAEHDVFWDAFQQNGTRTNYNVGFYGSGFNFDNFYPKYDIKPTGSAGQLFYAWETAKHKFSLKQRLEECGVVLDTSKATSLTMAFNYAHVTEIPTIDFTGLTNPSGTTAVFGNSWGDTRTIEKIITKEDNTYVNWFNNATGLINVKFEGSIGNNIDFKSCSKLSNSSIESVINALSDTTTGKSVTLSKTAVENTFSRGEKTTIPFSFDTDLEDRNITVVDNGDGTVTVNGDVPYDTEFGYREFETTFPAGSYIISEPIHNMGYVICRCYDLEGNKLPMEYIGEIGETNQSILNTDNSFVVKACVYLQGHDYIDYVIPYPTIQLANSFEALIATKPNWTINLV